MHLSHNLFSSLVEFLGHYLPVDGFPSVLTLKVQITIPFESGKHEFFFHSDTPVYLSTRGMFRVLRKTHCRHAPMAWIGQAVRVGRSKCAAATSNHHRMCLQRLVLTGSPQSKRPTVPTILIPFLTRKTTYNDFVSLQDWSVQYI